MTVDRAIEILDPDHREDYESIKPINEACRMGIKALRWMETACIGGEWPMWTSVEDELPENGDNVLGVIRVGPVGFGSESIEIGVVYWNAATEAFYWAEGLFYETIEVTHWMPLPPLP